jgi:hypothetical protein
LLELQINSSKLRELRPREAEHYKSRQGGVYWPCVQFWSKPRACPSTYFGWEKLFFSVLALLLAGSQNVFGWGPKLHITLEKIMTKIKTGL